MFVNKMKTGELAWFPLMYARIQTLKKLQSLIRSVTLVAMRPVLPRTCLKHKVTLAATGDV